MSPPNAGRIVLVWRPIGCEALRARLIGELGDRANIQQILRDWSSMRALLREVEAKAIISLSHASVTTVSLFSRISTHRVPCRRGLGHQPDVLRGRFCPEPILVTLGPPTGKSHGQNEVVRLAFAPRLERVVAQRRDLGPETLQLLSQRLCLRKASRDVEPSRLHQDLQDRHQSLFGYMPL
jgi:hypothetical protein